MSVKIPLIVKCVCAVLFTLVAEDLNESCVQPQIVMFPSKKIYKIKIKIKSFTEKPCKIFYNELLIVCRGLKVIKGSKLIFFCCRS